MVIRSANICAILAFAILAGCSSGGIRPSPEYSGLSSAQLEQFYAEQEEKFLQKGYLRVDNGNDTQVSSEQLVRNFLRIAFYDEYTVRRGQFIKATREARLRRWENPVRIKVHFGQSLSAEQRQFLSRQIVTFVDRLRRLTGLEIGFVEQQPNFDVIIFNQEERLDFLRHAENENIRVSRAVANGIINSPGNVFCAAFALLNGWPNAHSYANSVILLKSEHPELMMQSCIHEEFSQALGLTNDSPRARPSIFNDDEEFALLTTHDELLLKILYDDRLEVGMSVAEARPIVQQIVREILAQA